jgi:hypothetical protein
VFQREREREGERERERESIVTKREKIMSRKTGKRAKWLFCIRNYFAAFSYAQKSRVYAEILGEVSLVG